MTARLIDGTAIAKRILDEVRHEVEGFRNERGRPPGLAVILVGENPASKIYVRRKKTESRDLGMVSDVVELPENSETAHVVDAVDTLNTRSDIDGFLVQLPLPPQIDAERVLRRINPLKDVDGLHPENGGLLLEGKPRFVPCTPAGILEILDREGVTVSGRHAVVVGRSGIVGKPVALLLLHRNATVTICHSRTPDLPGVCSQADILVVATGKPAMVTGDFIRAGATVIDVGISRLTDRQQVEAVFGAGHPALAKLEKNGSVLVGDVHPVQGADKAGAITPVPGGVGPLTIAMLMRNTLKAACLS